jgi:hypothetical protein
MSFERMIVLGLVGYAALVVFCFWLVIKYQ